MTVALFVPKLCSVLVVLFIWCLAVPCCGDMLSHASGR